MSLGQGIQPPQLTMNKPAGNVNEESFDRDLRMVSISRTTTTTPGSEMTVMESFQSMKRSESAGRPAGISPKPMPFRIEGL